MSIVINPISPTAFSVFGLPIRWYALAYIAAFLVGYFLFRAFARRSDSGLNMNKHELDDLFSWIILGVIIGGRLGYVLFYNLPFELIPIRISDFVLALAAILSLISGAKYYIMAKPYLKDR